MKQNQHFTKLTQRLIASSLMILTSLSITTHQARAGGYDDPNILTDEERAARSLGLSTMLSWEKWEKPYISGRNLCRAKNGDVICLSLKTAKKLGAHIYSPKKASTSTTAKVQPSSHR